MQGWYAIKQIDPKSKSVIRLLYLAVLQSFQNIPKMSCQKFEKISAFSN